ncbi:MAG: IclR family transcriptional regulator [Ilumatobacteraceae bacterium]
MDIVTGVGVLDKSLLVLRAVAVEPLGLQALQEATGLPRATAHRLAVALEAHGMLRRHPDGRFDLGIGLAAFARVASERFPLAERALPVLTGLRDETGESVQLFVRDGDHRRCLVSLPSPHALRWIVAEGVQFPLALGSAGRVLTGGAGPGGWVESVAEREPGVASTSAPVIDGRGAIIAALSISGPIDRLTRHPGRRFGAAVVDAARALSTALAT